MVKHFVAVAPWWCWWRGIWLVWPPLLLLFQPRGVLLAFFLSPARTLCYSCCSTNSVFFGAGAD